MALLVIPLVVAAVACFVWASRPHPAHPSSTDWTAVGFALFALAWATQVVIGPGHWHWVIR